MSSVVGKAKVQEQLRPLNNVAYTWQTGAGLVLVPAKLAQSSLWEGFFQELDQESKGD